MMNYVAAIESNPTPPTPQAYGARESAGLQYGHMAALHPRYDGVRSYDHSPSGHADEVRSHDHSPRLWG